MRTIPWLSSTVLATLALAGHAAIAPTASLAGPTVGQHGDGCMSTNPQLGYSVFSPFAQAMHPTSNPQLWCSFVRQQSADPRELYVDYEDDSSTGELACTVTVWDSFTKALRWIGSFHSGVAFVGNNVGHLSIPSTVFGYGLIDCKYTDTRSTWGVGFSGWNLL